MEIPEELINKLKVQNKREEDQIKKQISSIQYKRRKLEKNVRDYTRENDPIRSRDIERLGIAAGFYIS
tara:strand:+ start:325 stop:528 length:204 start_codon:yes stop_codon:yes gene_type:complete